MSLLSIRSAHRTDDRRRPAHHHRWWRTAASAAAALALAASAAATVTGAPAQANPTTGVASQDNCLTIEFQPTTWNTGPDSGGVANNIVLTNTCDTAVTGWTLALTLPAGHTFQQGWNATWTLDGNTATATPGTWNKTIGAGRSISIGYVATWTGSYQEPDCTINGQPCDGTDPGPGPAPEVTLTSPLDGSYVPAVCAIQMTAEASTTTGTIARVEFYINNHLVGSDTTAPYGISVPQDHPALRDGNTTIPRHTAFARVVTVSPAATADSAPVGFTPAPMPPALMVVACPSRVNVPEGGTATVTFVVTACAATPALHLTVTGEPGVTVTPTVTRPGSREHPITITAAPGSAGAVAQVTARPDNSSCMPATAQVTVVPAA
ncbi:cellulose binding domain-containing protein [Solwaraspora sp. WMMD406]|uniref:cellulose binding domain-containing protein n=1 Tax=Solwaraspora sp. WMMD406 TaxID=3016095 RepID=UPI00241685E8|nr:cellulose binding domain-containing protein [Solwaraspora sp. WMMD406]MDG4763449.1 cellulose binding domain-containing protein [Solwaraspora sp. WMMD406]